MKKFTDTTMKPQVIRIITILCVFLCSQIYVLGQTITFPLTRFHQSLDHNDESEFGHRLPSRPIIAQIDFDSKQISLSQPIDDIESYEIWNEDRSEILYSTTNESDCVQAIAGLCDTPIIFSINTHTYTLTSN